MKHNMETPKKKMPKKHTMTKGDMEKMMGGTKKPMKKRGKK